jgi:hypothetical protein
MLAGRNSAFSEFERTEFEDLVDDYASGFAMGTGNRAQLDYILMETPKSPIGGPCEQHRDCDGDGSACLTIPPVAPGSGMCTHGCQEGSECPDTWCCQPASSGALVCLPSEMCRPVDPPDAGMMPDPCACDTSAACEAGCACDMACADAGVVESCSCDDTYSCDRDRNDKDALCACDPECEGLTIDDLEEDSGPCTCVRAKDDRDELLGGLALFAIGIAIALSKTHRPRGAPLRRARGPASPSPRGRQ